MEDQAFVLKGHNESITALTISGFHLISASEDFTFCLWDIVNLVVFRRFNNRQVALTNMVVIKQSSLLPISSYQRVPNQFQVSLLQKYPQPSNSCTGITMFLSSLACHNKQTPIHLHGNNLLALLISGFDRQQEEQRPALLQMKLEKNIDD
ncbi:uncharacterized protein LOC120139465 [Hibiscus syriacus]|uniref:uncharacterized protein LOC120139465 n=1 Tax=Hibiscus syriacus TaxID=106335 RepID=UPI001921B719|nr:uncharacterized protein LOC120139465 [Hibiscus syriacus]